MKPKLVFLIIALFLLAAIVFVLVMPKKTEAPHTDTSGKIPLEMELIQLTKPAPNSLVKSPLTIEGRARGVWFFEASFPIKILDFDGKQIGVSHAEALGEWMTMEFVPFRGIVEFSPPAADTGFLVLEKDNPSGLPENAAEIRYPIRFR